MSVNIYTVAWSDPDGPLPTVGILARTPREALALFEAQHASEHVDAVHCHGPVRFISQPAYVELAGRLTVPAGEDA